MAKPIEFRFGWEVMITVEEDQPQQLDSHQPSVSRFTAVESNPSKLK
jgi:hypothetical protein